MVSMPVNTHSEATTSRAWWRNLSAWAGLLAMCGGVLHTVNAVLMRHEVWAQIGDEGFFNTVTLEPTADRLAVAEAYWFSVGSFGVPLLLLGALVTWLTRRGDRVPGWLGCGVAAWAVLMGLLGAFSSGSITLLSIGVLLAIGGWNSRRAPARRTRAV
jgi:hypothetical protein